ncbi:unnamed protein product [Fusarium graminearum]|nr:unnamed protein product [Fusarium graminearum]
MAHNTHGHSTGDTGDPLFTLRMFLAKTKNVIPVFVAGLDTSCILRGKLIVLQRALPSLSDPRTLLALKKMEAPHPHLKTLLRRLDCLLINLDALIDKDVRNLSCQFRDLILRYNNDNDNKPATHTYESAIRGEESASGHPNIDALESILISRERLEVMDPSISDANSTLLSKTANYSTVIKRPDQDDEKRIMGSSEILQLSLTAIWPSLTGDATDLILKEYKVGDQVDNVEDNVEEIINRANAACARLKTFYQALSGALDKFTGWATNWFSPRSQTTEHTGVGSALREHTSTIQYLLAESVFHLYSRPSLLDAWQPTSIEFPKTKMQPDFSKPFCLSNMLFADLNTPTQDQLGIDTYYRDAQAFMVRPSEVASTWFAKFEEMSEFLDFEDDSPEYTKDPVKVAVLDSGLSEFYQNKPNITYKSFIENPSTHGKDNSEHGTDSVALIQKAYSRVELYVAKVFDGNDADCNTATYMAKAIDWAMQNNVDIISISAGFKEDHAELERQVKKATAGGEMQEILIFAAASNWQDSQGGVAFPARMADRVTCIFCCNGGRRSSREWNPRARTGTSNFTMIGEDVVLDSGKKLKGGTSVSTALAAGLAAKIIDFSRQPDICDFISESTRRKLKTKAGMDSIFKGMSGEPDREGYECIEPWQILPADSKNKASHEKYRITVRQGICTILGKFLQMA